MYRGWMADHGVESGERGWQIGRIRYCIAVCFRGRRMCRWPTFLTTRWISQHGLAETRKRGHCATVLLLFIQTRGLAALHKSIYLSGAKRLVLLSDGHAQHSPAHLSSSLQPIIITIVNVVAIETILLLISSILNLNIQSYIYIYLEFSNFSQDFFPFEIQFDAINSIDISLLLFETRKRERNTHRLF